MNLKRTYHKQIFSNQNGWKLKESIKHNLTISSHVFQISIGYYKLMMIRSQDHIKSLKEVREGLKAWLQLP